MVVKSKFDLAIFYEYGFIQITIKKYIFSKNESEFKLRYKILPF